QNWWFSSQTRKTIATSNGKFMTASTQVNHDDKPVKQMLYPALLFLIVGLFIGVFISYNGFLVPDYFKGQYIHFGRVRPVHVTVVTLLWLLSANMGLMYYFVPRLCG